MTLAYAGCRLSEAVALTADRVDLVAGVLVFESLKKRRTGIFRHDSRCAGRARHNI
jgi:integrase/recombinase XerD